jgi:hypothetical protein
MDSKAVLTRKSELRWGRIVSVCTALLAVYLVGQFVADVILQRFDLVMHVRSEPTFHRLIMTASSFYVALMAIPFMPGAEIGISMILLFGSKICLLVYVFTVLALIPPYIIGRLIPARYCAKAFGFVGLKAAQRLTEQLAPLSSEQRLAYLMERAPTRFGTFFVRHRFLALAVLLNLPGNIVIGGGGGIAMIAGMTRLYSLPTFLLTVSIAVAPVPLIIAFSEI